MLFPLSIMYPGYTYTLLGSRAYGHESKIAVYRHLAQDLTREILLNIAPESVAQVVKETRRYVPSLAIGSIDALIEVEEKAYEELGWGEPPFTSEWLIFFGKGQPVAAVHNHLGKIAGLPVPKAIEDIRKWMDVDLTQIPLPELPDGFAPFYAGLTQSTQH